MVMEKAFCKVTVVKLGEVNQSQKANPYWSKYL